MNLEDYVSVKVFVNDVFLCTMPEHRVEPMLNYLRGKGITNVTVKEIIE